MLCRFSEEAPPKLTRSSAASGVSPRRARAEISDGGGDDDGDDDDDVFELLGAAVDGGSGGNDAAPARKARRAAAGADGARPATGAAAPAPRARAPRRVKQAVPAARRQRTAGAVGNAGRAPPEVFAQEGLESARAGRTDEEIARLLQEQEYASYRSWVAAEGAAAQAASPTRPAVVQPAAAQEPVPRRRPQAGTASTRVEGAASVSGSSGRSSSTRARRPRPAARGAAGPRSRRRQASGRDSTTRAFGGRGRRLDGNDEVRDADVAAVLGAFGPGDRSPTRGGRGRRPDWDADVAAVLGPFEPGDRSWTRGVRGRRLDGNDEAWDADVAAILATFEPGDRSSAALYGDALGFPGRSLAAHPGNYLDDGEIDMSYEGLLRLGETVGNAKQEGLHPTVIYNLPTRIFQSCNAQGATENPDQRQCCICLSDYEQGDGLRSLPCFHCFHTACIDEWLASNEKCPICRECIRHLVEGHISDATSFSV